MPSADAQLSNIRALYNDAGLNVDKTAYVECHGTGTPAGDPKEALAISQAFCAGRAKDKPIYIGSIKPNVGHLEGAAGVAGLIKAILSIERGYITKNLYFDPAIGNPDIKFDEWKVKVSDGVTLKQAAYLRHVLTNPPAGPHRTDSVAYQRPSPRQRQLLRLWRHQRSCHPRRCLDLHGPARHQW